ncbi:DUF6968 family protein [Saccharopolyspora sp. 5N708]|uniref:DUF6968 family protein n=1 Tax=Saccharopolyspora sp. 5N708 TaxID=3457424 RepID=UPI003FD2F562
MTMTYELGETVAERQVDAIAEDGNRTPVIVKIGKPQPDPMPGGDWYCPRQVLGLGDESVQATFGVDSLQAFLLCVYGLRLNLAERAERASVELDWLGLPDLGLTVDPQVHQIAPPAPGRSSN